MPFKPRDKDFHSIFVADLLDPFAFKFKIRGMEFYIFVVPIFEIARYLNIITS